MAAPAPESMDALQARAAESAALQRHALGPWKALSTGTTSMAECTQCGRLAFVRMRPVNLSGEALSVQCRLRPRTQKVAP